MKKTLLTLFIGVGVTSQLLAQSWTKVSGIADTVNIKAVTQIDDRILISGILKGGNTTYHFSSPDGNTDWKKLPTFDYAGTYLFGLPQNKILLGGGFLGCKKLTGNTWTTNFNGSAFAEFPDGTIIGGNANYPDSVYTYTSAGDKGKSIGKFTLKFGPKYSLGNSGRLFLHVNGYRLVYIDQADKTKLITPSKLDGAAVLEYSVESLIFNYISEIAKLSDGTLIAASGLNTILRSVDNGDSWTTIISKNSIVGLAVVVNSKDEIFIIFEDKVMVSVDKGLTYSDISTGLPAFKVDLFLNSKNELFAICNSNGSSVNPTKSGIYKYNNDITGIFSTNSTVSFSQFYPNPAEKEITIDINEYFEQGKFTLYTTNMQEVQTTTLTQNQSKIELSQVAKGMYIAQFVINGKTQSQKLIIK